MVSLARLLLTPRGEIGRHPYWLITFCVVACGIVGLKLGLHLAGAWSWPFWLGLVWVFACAALKRLNRLNWPRWWILIPFFVSALIVMGGLAAWAVLFMVMIFGLLPHLIQTVGDTVMSAVLLIAVLPLVLGPIWLGLSTRVASPRQTSR